MQSLLNDYTFLTLSAALLPMYGSALTAVLMGLAGKLVLGVEFGKSFLLAAIALVLFYVFNMMLMGGLTAGTA